jgi:hypothetical protein
MPKSKHRKNHKQKVAARSQKIKEAKARMQKVQRQFLMDLINREKEKGLFENTPMINSIDAPQSESSSTGPIVEGPAI